jgi:hypothetical protein
MWKKINNNPTGRAVGDCAVRAVSAALGVDWETAYALMAINGYSMGDMPSSNSVWGAVLRQHGFYRFNLPDTCPDCYTFGDFARDNPRGVFVVGTGTHVATIIDGILMDAWDSSDQPVAFVWYRKDD